MSQKVGPGFDDFGLVFAYDTGDTNSFRGEPTTNLAYASNPNLTSNSNWWFNSGESVLLNNDTTLEKPIIPHVDTSNLHIFSSRVTVAGNQHIGSAIISISPSTQYTMSIYFWFQGSTMQAAPYLRTAVNNNGLATFAYNGDTNYLNWPRGKWIRLSATFTTQANETGVYMSSYTGDFVGEKVAYFGYQLEQKDHMTPLVLGTRNSSTQSLLDYTGNRTIEIGNASFNSSGQMIFDGTNDYLAPGSFNLLGMGASTLEAVIYMENLSSPDNSYSIFGGISDEGYHGYHEIRNSGSGYKMTFWTATDGWRYSNTALSAQTWYHVVWVWNGLNLTFYLNGQNDGSFTFTTFSPYGLGFNRISSFPNERYMNGKIPLTKVYNRGLSSNVIAENYNNYKKRFGI